VDGIYGPQTRAAVIRFQRANGLLADGIAGPQTLAALGIAAGARETQALAARSASTTSTTSSATSGSSTSALLQRIAECESGGDPTMVSSNGVYRGKYQFAVSTWRAVGGSGDPAAAPEAEQDRRAAMLLRVLGPSAWPVCANS
jgi:peptidoglycan hydrolase-like protein with peptidoglycan-binding domain